jgi:[FeFe] hydrogenase H-cluster maturation GTPase HydF
MTIVVKEREYARALSLLSGRPDLVVGDSQAVLKMVADTPQDIPCTTFSILFGRQKGDLREYARGAAAINRLRSGDRVLIAEACTHHALQDDIGRVKIPRWLRQFTGLDLRIDITGGHDFPPDLAEYGLIVHCGSCMLTRKETLSRIGRARQAQVPITNYGVCISVLQGVAPRVLSPFPSALDTYHTELNSLPSGRQP